MSHHEADVKMGSREIEQLVYRYARLIDAGDFQAIAELFRHGRICTPIGEPVVGYDAVLAMYQRSTRLYPDGTPRTRHVTTNLSIEINDTLATCQSYFTVMQALPDFPLQAIICGHYEDQLELHEGQWRFATRTMYPQLLGDLSRHLLFDSKAMAQ